MTSTSAPPRKKIDARRALHLAQNLASLGRPSEAIELCRLVLMENPDDLAALCGLSALLGQSGREAESANILGLAEQASDGSADAHFRLATACCKLGRQEAAVEHYRRCLAKAPQRADAHHNLGVALQALGRLDEALSHHAIAAELAPTLPDPLAELGKLNRVLGRLDQAAELYRGAIALSPGDAGLCSDLAGVLHQLGRREEAIDCCRRALATAPDTVAAHFNLASLLQEQEDLDGAVEHFQRALALNPGFAEAQNNLGNALQQLGRRIEAAEAYERALRLKPDYADAHANLGKALRALGRNEEAIDHYAAAVAVEPSRAALQNEFGVALLTAGRGGEAQQAFEDATRLAPENVIYHYNLASFRRFAPDDPRLAALEGIAGKEATLGADDRISLNFALARAYADLGRTDKSFQRLNEGNRLKRLQTVYDEGAALRHFEEIRAAFTPELFRAGRGGGASSQKPIFVVGMPRSGTTLIEQILASHSSVHGAGEIDTLSRIAAGLSEGEDALPPYPAMMRGLTPDALQRIGDSYLAEIAELAPASERVVDKMPGNFVLVGLIALAMPGARIIHARRDPVDTCFSCYSLLFAEDQPFAYDLGELGRYYRAYADLMDHWRRILPPGVLVDVQYEKLVADFPVESRRLLAHCGLDWQDACENFHETRRTVLTASVAQVRRPLYADSVGRWRPYAAHLQPLLEALRIEPSEEPMKKDGEPVRPPSLLLDSIQKLPALPCGQVDGFAPSIQRIRPRGEAAASMRGAQPNMPLELASAG